MEYQNRIYIPSEDAEPCDPPFLRCLPGKVAVAMHKPKETFASLALPDAVQGRLRPDCGTVAAVGGPRMMQSAAYGWDCHLERGMEVLVRPAQGMWEDELFFPVQVRFYGGGHSGSVYQNVDWWDDVVAYRDGSEWRPTGSNLLVRREKDDHPLLQLESWKREGVVLDQGPYIGDDMTGLKVAWCEGKFDDVLILDFGIGGDDSIVIVPDYLIGAIGVR